MMRYSEMSQAQKQEAYQAAVREFEDCKEKHLKLNMARGKPGAAQLDLVSDLLTMLQEPEQCMIDGVDARNYGEVSGLHAAKVLFADILGCSPEECIIGGNASLALMYDTVSRAYTHGLLRSPEPWSKLPCVKWLCPAPGYDRHFKISESFGMEMITVPMTESGPDMDVVEQLVKDPAVKGMWCVPKYSNPEGIIYGDETIDRIAALHPAAPDFALMWDNAYCVHEFDGDFVPFRDIVALCRQAGNPDMIYEFASTSKITFPGAGISVLASSVDNIRYITGLLSIQVISYDKVNQLRHVRFLKDKETTLALMQRHAQILKPKFDAVVATLQREIAPLGLARWTEPKGGYFISVDTLPGLATRTLALCKEAGVVMTPAGATFPYGKDPQDANIRIAPSLPPVAELEQAMQVFCICLRMAALEQAMA